MIKWIEDAEQDMLTYRLIQLATIFLEMCFAQKTDLMKAYKKAVKKPSAEPVLLAGAFMPDGAQMGLILAENAKGFQVAVEHPEWMAHLFLIYDFDKKDIDVASVSLFKGDTLVAIGWIARFLSDIDTLKFE